MRLPSRPVIILGAALAVFSATSAFAQTEPAQNPFGKTAQATTPAESTPAPKKKRAKAAPKAGEFTTGQRRKRVVLATPSSGSIQAPKFTITPEPPLTGRQSGACICARKTPPPRDSVLPKERKSLHRRFYKRRRLPASIPGG